MDFDKDVIAPHVAQGGIFAYRSSEYVHDVGTHIRLESVSRDIVSGLVKNKNLRNPQKAVFLDRDGTVNVHKGYITAPGEIELIGGVAEAINKFHSRGYLVILITNQPVLARGECTFEELNNIHSYLEMLLAEKGAYFDGIYVCPHHPDKGFDGEVKKLKTECDCRKPSPGLILKAGEYFNIDLSSSFMVGDSMTDVLAGKAAGCKSVLISAGKVEADGFGVYKTLFDFSQQSYTFS